jgi:hypothetical protein
VREGEEVGRKRKEKRKSSRVRGKRGKRGKEKKKKRKEKGKKEKKWDTCPIVSGWKKIRISSPANRVTTCGRIRFFFY